MTWRALPAGVGARWPEWSTGWRASPRVGWQRWPMRRALDAPCRRMPPMWRPWRRRWRCRRPLWASPSTSGPPSDSRPLWSSRPVSISRPAGGVCSWRSTAGCADAPNTRSSTCNPRPPWPPRAPRWPRWGKKVRAEPEHPEHYELHFQDETHLETNPYLCRVWHRRGTQPTLPGGGANRRVTGFGSVEALGRAPLEPVRAAPDTAGVVRYLELL